MSKYVCMLYKYGISLCQMNIMEKLIEKVKNKADMLECSGRLD